MGMKTVTWEDGDNVNIDVHVNPTSGGTAISGTVLRHWSRVNVVIPRLFCQSSLVSARVTERIVFRMASLDVLSCALGWVSNWLILADLNLSFSTWNTNNVGKLSVADSEYTAPSLGSKRRIGE